MSIIVLRPTRGLEFAESAESIEAALCGYDHLPTKRSWDQSIPGCFNNLVWCALVTQCSEFLFVEEDVVIPPDAIPLMRALKSDISAINYRNKVDPSRISELRLNGELAWVSLGCTLIKRHVFEGLTAPWFVTGKSIAREHPGRKLVLVDSPADIQYGNQDQYFCFVAKAAGYSIASVPDVLCDHLILEERGKFQDNDGCHKIRRA